MFNIDNNQLQMQNIVQIKDPKEKRGRMDSESNVDSELSDGYDLLYQ